MYMHIQTTDKTAFCAIRTALCTTTCHVYFCGKLNAIVYSTTVAFDYVIRLCVGDHMIYLMVLFWSV